MERVKEIVEKFNELCTPSLCPESNSKLTDVIISLHLSNEELRNSIDWEFIEWAEKDNGLASLKGFDDYGNEYVCNATYDHMNNEVLELVEDIEPIEIGGEPIKCPNPVCESTNIENKEKYSFCRDCRRTFTSKQELKKRKWKR